MTAASPKTFNAGIRKAAILVASLEQEASDRLLDQLGPECAELVLEAVLLLDEIDPEEQRRIIAEFRRIGPMVPDQCPAGIELNDPVIERTYLSARRRGEIIDSFELSDACSMRNEAEREQAASQPFGFLYQAEQQKLLGLLSTERPQTIALVLSHLPPERAGEVLSLFAPPLQVEVVRRLVDLEDTDAETLRHVEDTLESRYSRQFASQQVRSAGPEAVARILASCDRRAVESILGNLATYDRPLAEQLGHEALRFDDLVRLDDDVLAMAIEAADPLVVQASLLGAPPRLIERILNMLSPKDAKRLTHKLDYPGPIRLSDIEEARQRLALSAERILYSNPRKTVMAA